MWYIVRTASAHDLGLRNAIGNPASGIDKNGGAYDDDLVEVSSWEKNSSLAVKSTASGAVSLADRKKLVTISANSGNVIS